MVGAQRKPGGVTVPLVQRWRLPEAETLQRRGDAHYYRLIGAVENAQGARLIAAPPQSGRT
jgi:hypothetical protein